LANGTYTFRATSETGQSNDYIVTIQAPVGDQPITAQAEWGPSAPSSGVIHLDFSEPVSGTALRAITLEYRGRKVSLRDHTVTTTDNQRYVITLPTRVRRETGDYAIILMYEQIRSLSDPTKTMDGKDSRIIILNAPVADPGQT
jgi:KaiC/GvpD/RAD55 family RecA-like ATPase